ncbi:hypothetical protein [Paenibacillus prosopidis]|uniref:Uncharacterized protein n=1 Tax=Paenibacillus prosopidis TaxID=630520 RepID=A0A368VR23_9BACL|nr:hypothetical protein [Paenibacillus prosopidis]RCW44360.1 hypothetical protein DFP97_112226 [Paenibacillus prosopidis]
MNPSMRSTLRRLGWGLVFPLVDLHLGSFDVLPDMIGYIMILMSLARLGAGDGGFKLASWLAAVLIFLSLPQLVIKTSIEIKQLTATPLGMHAYVQGTAILHALLAYLIFRGLYTIARPIAPPELLDAIVTRRKLYMDVFAVQLIFYPFLINLDESWPALLLIIGILIFVAELLMIRIPFRLSHIRNTPIDHDDNPGAAPL